MGIFRERMRALREEKNLTQQGLAEALNIGKSALALYETEKRHPDPETLQKLSRFFDCSVDYLLGISDIRNPEGPTATFPALIKRARLNKGISVNELSRLVGLTNVYIDKIEAGEYIPDKNTVIELARALELPQDELLLKVDLAKSGTQKELDILEALEDGDTKVTAGDQPLSREQRLSILRALVNPTKTQATESLKVPALGIIRAGIPLLSEQNIIGYVDIPADLEHQVDFALYVRGDSMIGAGIAENDIVICKEDHSPNPGQIVVALVNGDETTLKFLIRENGQDVLRAANPEYEDIKLKPGDEFQGHVVKVIKDPPSINLYRDYIYLKEGHYFEWNEVIEKAIASGMRPSIVNEFIEVQIEMAKKLAGKKNP